jgi:hypothetical protein
LSSARLSVPAGSKSGLVEHSRQRPLFSALVWQVIWQDMEATARTQATFLNPIERAMADKQWDRAMRYALMVYPERSVALEVGVQSP